MEDSKLLKLADWIANLFVILAILCVISAMCVNVMNKYPWYGKVQQFIAIAVVLSAIVLMALRYFIKNDHDLRQPKQKKASINQNEEISDETPNPAATSSMPTASTEGEQISNRLMIHVMDNTKQRLIVEIKYQKNTSYVNLILSLLLSAIALYVMWVYAFESKDETFDAQATLVTTRSWLDFAYVAIPKFGLALFIELVALSFYKTYKSNLDNIKYYQNELTSIESRRIALYAAIMKDNDDNIKSCVDTLLKIDRNFKLSDGESTIELEKLKIDYSYLSKVIKSFKGVINIKED